MTNAAGPAAPVRTAGHGHCVDVAGVAVAAIAGAAAFAWGNTRYAEWVTLLFDTDSRRADGLLFSALPFTLAVAVVVWRPAMFGLTLGSSLRRWRLVVTATVALCGLAAAVLAMLADNPFSGTDLVVQVIAVPVSEELLFRGVLFTLVALALQRIHPLAHATLLAVTISGLAFGLAHLNNIGQYETLFVLLQALNAVVLGVTTGYVRAATGSVYPAILVHAAVNLVATAM